MPVFVGALDLTVVSAVLPALLLELRIPLRTGLDDASWAVSGYLLAYALGVVVMGRASDHLGRRTAFLASLAAFFVGSWLVASATGAPAEWIAEASRFAGALPDRDAAALSAVVGGRIVGGFGAGAMVPVAIALASDLFGPDERALPIGLIAAVDTAGWTLGHLYGALVVQVLPWSALFWVNLPISAAAFAVVWWALPPPTPSGGRFDLVGALLAGVVLVTLNAALVGAGAFFMAVALAAAGALLVAERRVRRPLVDLGFLASRDRAAALTANALVGFALMVALVSVPLLVNAAGASTAEIAAFASAVLLAAFTVPLAIAALAGGAVSPRVGPRVVAFGGLALAAGAMLALASARPEAARQAVALVSPPAFAAGPQRELLEAAGALALAGVGLGVTLGPLAAAVVGAARPDERGMTAALVIAVRLLGMMASISWLTAYGLERHAALTPAAFAGILLTDAQRLLDASLALMGRVTGEMATAGAVACGLAAIAALAVQHNASGSRAAR